MYLRLQEAMYLRLQEAMYLRLQAAMYLRLQEAMYLRLQEAMYLRSQAAMYLRLQAAMYLRFKPIADSVALNLKINFQTFSTNQNSAHGIYDQYQAINDESHENPGTPGTESKVFGNNLKVLCHPTRVR